MNNNPKQQSHDKRKDVPSTEGAMFRSVSMSVAPPSSLLRRFDEPETTKQPALVNTHAFHKQPVLLKSHSAPPLANHESLLDAVPPFVWSLNESHLKEVPLFHPLERTAVTLSDITLKEVTSRISDFLRTHNVQANYNDSSVDCLTDEGLKFRIQLWKDETNPSAIVMEIQRRQGCCLAMQAWRHDALSAVYGIAPTKSTAPPPGWVSQMIEEQIAHLPVHKWNDPSCFANAIELTQRLLSSVRWDERRLGLESLVVLVDPAKMVHGEATKVAHLVVTDQGWHDLLVPYLVEQPPSESLSMKEFATDMQLLTLQILAHALEQEATSISKDTSFWNQVVMEASWLKVQEASHQPLLAAWASRILACVGSVPPHYKDSLVKAHHYGCQHHRGLQEETFKLLKLVAI